MLKLLENKQRKFYDKLTFRFYFFTKNQILNELHRQVNLVILT